ncbi:hypothetical protein BH09VER1_BH09VER1_15730 [soil metagenome]
MTPINALVFGLGLFFLGLRMVGESLRRLAGPGFREIIKRTSHRPVLTAGLGVGVGALMQSATAVTFIMVSMTGSGLITARAAAPLIVWCNVGLTALAFLTTLNIHPLVAYLVGGAGIALGTIKIPYWQSVAGALLGVGLILCGLEQMGAGATPLKDAPWFHHAIGYALAYSPLTFLAGVAAAMLLQSNTGAAMLVITFATTGVVDQPQAMLLIYGSNLGAIALRFFLAAGLAGEQLRLVRLEDFFCVASGLVMITLYALEAAGVPLVGALVGQLSAPIATKLAVVFLLSNLLPALLVSVFIRPCRHLLEKMWPDRQGPNNPSTPLYIHSQALDDPPSALDLLQKELAHLLSLITISRGLSSEEDPPPPDFQKLSKAIEEFAAKLGATNALTEAMAGRLHLLRAELSIIRHVEEGVRYFSQAVIRQKGSPQLIAAMKDLLSLAVEAAQEGKSETILKLRQDSKLKGIRMEGLQKAADTSSLSETALYEDFSIAVWTLHRLAKILDRLNE